MAEAPTTPQPGSRPCTLDCISLLDPIAYRTCAQLMYLAFAKSNPPRLPDHPRMLARWMAEPGAPDLVWRALCVKASQPDRTLVIPGPPLRPSTRLKTAHAIERAYRAAHPADHSYAEELADWAIGQRMPGGMEQDLAEQAQHVPAAQRETPAWAQGGEWAVQDTWEIMDTMLYSSPL